MVSASNWHIVHNKHICVPWKCCAKSCGNLMVQHIWKVSHLELNCKKNQIKFLVANVIVPYNILRPNKHSPRTICSIVSTCRGKPMRVFSICITQVTVNGVSHIRNTPNTLFFVCVSPFVPHICYCHLFFIQLNIPFLDWSTFRGSINFRRHFVTFAMKCDNTRPIRTYNILLSVYGQEYVISACIN